MPYPFTVLLLVFSITLTQCKKDNDRYQYQFTITINGQTISETWQQGPGSDLAMGADLDPGIVAGVIRSKCDVSGKTCYRFSFETTQNQKGNHDPVSLIFDITKGSTTNMYHYNNANENGNMTITLDNIQPPPSTTRFGVISGTFKGHVYLDFPEPGQAILVPVEGSFSIPTIP